MQSDYYKEQKKWALDVMGKNKTEQAATTSAKPPVCLKLLELLNASFVTVLTNHKHSKFEKVKPAIMPQLFLHRHNSHKVVAGNDYGLNETIMVTEGASVSFGMPFSCLKSQNHLEAQQQELSKMDVKGFLELVQKFGFYANIKAGSAIIIPHGYCVASVCPGKDDAHGIHILCCGSDKNPSKIALLIKHITTCFTKYKEGMHGEIETFINAVSNDEKE